MVSDEYLCRLCVVPRARVAGGDFWMYRRSWGHVSVTTDLTARSHESYCYSSTGEQLVEILKRRRMSQDSL